MYSGGDPNPNGINTGKPKAGTEFMGTSFKRICDCIAKKEHYDVCQNKYENGKRKERENLKSFKTSYIVLHKKSAYNVF